jgi:hypothetical protein
MSGSWIIGRRVVGKNGGRKTKKQDGKPEYGDLSGLSFGIH